MLPEPPLLLSADSLQEQVDWSGVLGASSVCHVVLLC